MRGCLAALFFVAACGDGSSSVPDAMPDSAPPPDILVFPGCEEFSAAVTQVPARVNGQLGNADVRSPASCEDIVAPAGIESAGPDRVIPLAGLVPGTPYVVRLTSAADLAFYVATGCETPAGPSAAQCLVFHDATRGEQELGRFVATAATAYVIVDYWESQSPSSLDFTLDVYAEVCQGAAQCDGTTPACFEGQCVECVSSFDCASATTPVCGATQLCAGGADACTTDDAVEPDDDGPAGATPLVLDQLGRSVVTGRICSSPRTELDFFSFEVTTLGETWDFQLAWTGGRDLDLAVYDAAGKQLGMSFWEQPESIRMTYLPPGVYRVRIREFSTAAVPAAVTYTFTARRTLGTACDAAADCAVEYRNQLYRGRCLAGACVEIAGAGAITEGEACDSQSDCAPGLSCPSFFFVSDADTRETCARTCANDGECAALGAGFVCTTYLADNFCVQRCTENDHCPTSIQSDPASGPWTRLRCETSTGRCVP